MPSRGTEAGAPQLHCTNGLIELRVYGEVTVMRTSRPACGLRTAWTVLPRMCPVFDTAHADGIGMTAVPTASKAGSEVLIWHEGGRPRAAQTWSSNPGEHRPPHHPQRRPHRLLLLAAGREPLGRSTCFAPASRPARDRPRSPPLHERTFVSATTTGRPLVIMRWESPCQGL